MKLFRELYRRERGFTLVELLVVIIVLGILAGLAVPRLMSIRERAEDAAISSVAGTIKTGMEVYYVEKEKYPDDGTGWGDLFQRPDNDVDTLDLEAESEYNIASFGYSMATGTDTDGNTTHHYLCEFESESTGKTYYLGEKGFGDTEAEASGHSF